MRDGSRSLRVALSGPRPAAFAAALVLAGLITAPAAAGPNLMVGIDDNAFVWSPSSTLPFAQDLGLKAVRVTLDWRPGQYGISSTTATQLGQLATSAPALRVVVSVGAPNPYLVPVTDTRRNEYCNFVGSVLRNVPAINDVVIWNEPNLSFFWRPQFKPDGSSAAPAAYEALLARCYDVLHSIRPGVNVIAPATCPRGNDISWSPDNISHSPGQFILGMGAAYRASGRQRPIFDTVGHHVYGTFPAERPWRVHSSSSAISEGDWRSLVDALSQAFNGTPQPVPGQCSAGKCVPIWYLEAGYQTYVDPAKARFYSGVEPWQNLVPAADGPPDPPDPSPTSWAPDQATQLKDGVRLAYCQPYVAAFFNFLLGDEADLSRWQSGVMWADRTPKPSYPAFKDIIAQVNSKTIDCGSLKGDQAAAGAVTAPGQTGQTGQTGSAAREKPLRLILSVPRKVRAGSVFRVWLRFNQVVTNEQIRLWRRRDNRFRVVLRRAVSGFAPKLKLRSGKPGHYMIRVAYRVETRYRFTRMKRIMVLKRPLRP